MCDYSLENVASRKAVVSDRLISTNFHYTVTRGFAGEGDLGTAVCLMPGTEVVFDTDPRYEDPTDLRQYTAPSKVARFRQVDVSVRYVHHDALEFADGTIVPVAERRDRVFLGHSNFAMADLVANHWRLAGSPSHLILGEAAASVLIISSPRRLYVRLRRTVPVAPVRFRAGPLRRL